MRGLPLLALLAAGAVALPHRLGASAVKKLGHVHPRRTAPSLAALDASLSALEADVDKLDLAVPKLERVAVALGAFALGVAIDVLVTKIAQKTTQAVANKVRRMFQTGKDEKEVEIPPLMAAETRMADACAQLRAHELRAEAADETIDMGGIIVQAEMGALPAARQKQVDSQDGEKVYFSTKTGRRAICPW